MDVDQLANGRVNSPKIFLFFFKKSVDKPAEVWYSIYRKREEPPEERKERTMKTTTEYIENTMEALVEEALAAMEAAGEKLPEIRYNEEE